MAKLKFSKGLIASAGLIMAGVTLWGTSPAVAGTKDDIRNLQERMLRVEQSSAAQTAATVKISELERQNQELTGRVEELNYKLDQAMRRLDSISAVLAGGDPNVSFDPYNAQPGADGFATQGPQGPVSLIPSGDPIADQIASTAPQSEPSGPVNVELPLNPEAAFDYASGFLLQGDYQKAKSAFALYVEAFPNQPRTPDAKFRLGEIHLALGENAAAADVFIEHIRSYPNDMRAAEAYLKLGTAFARMEKSSEACTVFKTMKTKYPNVALQVRQRADIEMSRINCQ